MKEIIRVRVLEQERPVQFRIPQVGEEILVKEHDFYKNYYYIGDNPHDILLKENCEVISKECCKDEIHRMKRMGEANEYADEWECLDCEKIIYVENF